MYVKQAEIKRCVDSTIEAFNRHEKHLLENGLNERCICSKFASYLEKVLYLSPFRDYDVDVEYNRGMEGLDGKIKRIDNDPVSLDLIIHKRGHDSELGYDNLLCMEMKKTTEPVYKINEYKDRLRFLTFNENGFCYRLGLMILINVAEKRIFIDELFCNEVDF